MNTKRKSVQDKIYKVMNQLDPSGKNKKIYENMFTKMSDKDFDDYMKRIRSGEDVLHLYAANLVDDLPVAHVTNVAKANNVKIFERIRMYDVVNDCYYYTPKEYAVLQLPIRRMVQFADHKLTIAEGDSRVDMLTGQVVKPDKGAGLSTGRTIVDRETGTKVRSAITIDLYYSGIHIESNVSGL